MRQMATALIVILLVLITQVALIPTASAMVAGEVAWYLSDTQATGFHHPGAHAYDKIMNKDTEGTEEHMLTLDAEHKAWWYTNGAPSNVVEFNGDWNITCWVKALSEDDKGKRVYTKLKVIDSSGIEIFSKQGYTQITNPGDIQLIEKTLSPSGTLSVPSGGRIAIEIGWVSTAAGDLEVYYGSSTHNSRLTCPPNSPVYPAPELPTIIYMSIGLGGIASIAILKRARYKSSRFP
ncbi:MAG: hypothetical protein SVY53_02345 [Chloroflexota bacterium]|nr:hypothetical protein [Chloroflexota bacterium]